MTVQNSKLLHYLPAINLQKETEKIVSFLKTTFAAQRIERAVIGVSGGVDSTVSLYLLAQALPPKNIFPLFLPFFKEEFVLKKTLAEQSGIPEGNFITLRITTPVLEAAKALGVETEDRGIVSKIRLGNIMVRIRMIYLFDQAKKHGALVCGTENKSERLLGYFTRFGDEASDIEPIVHLYKSQIYELAKYLKVPEKIIKMPPSAGLWQGQTDGGQFGFSYKQADQVLYLFFEKKLPMGKIVECGFKNAGKIIDFANFNLYKSIVPYKI